MNIKNLINGILKLQNSEDLENIRADFMDLIVDAADSITTARDSEDISEHIEIIEASWLTVKMIDDEIASRTEKETPKADASGLFSNDEVKDLFDTIAKALGQGSKATGNSTHNTNGATGATGATGGFFGGLF